MLFQSKAGSQSKFALEANADRIVLGLIALCFVVFALHNIIAYDFWWQLKTGQLVRQSGFPSTDPFSYGFPGRVWIEVRWLYCVVISFMYDWLGPDDLIIAKVLFLSLAGFCLWQFGRRGAQWAVNIGLLSALILMHQRLMIRPELVTYVLLAVYLLLIRRFQSEGKIHWLIPLPLLQIIWVNSHTLYVLGPAVLWLSTGAEFIDQVLLRPENKAVKDRLSVSNLKRLASISIGVSLACLVNPYGINGALFGLELFSQIQSDNALGGLITELRSPFSASRFGLLFVSYCVVIVISAFGFMRRRGSLSLSWFSIWVAFLYLSVMAERNVALFGIVACASIIINYGTMSIRPLVVWSARGACALFALVMIPLVVSNYYYRSIDPDRRFGLGVAQRRFPIRALEFVETQGLPLPVITGLAESSYPLFKYGQGSVYVDGRLDVYGSANVTEAVKTFSTGEGLLETVMRLNVFTLIAHLENDSVLIQRLINDPTWAAVYFDDSHIIFVLNAPSTDSLIHRLKIDWQNPHPINADPPQQLSADHVLTGLFPAIGESGPSRAVGKLFLLAGNTALAQKSFEETLRQWPEDPQACFSLGVMYRAQKREPEAKILLARVPEDMFKQHNNLVFAATMYEANKNMQAASDAWLQLVTLGNRSPEVYQHLAQAAVEAEKWDAAYIAFDALSKTSLNDVKTLNNLGAVAYKVNKKQEAISALERSLQLDSAQPETATEMGLMKLKLGDKNGARQAFEKAVAADPSFEPAVKYLEKMRVAQNQK